MTAPNSETPQGDPLARFAASVTSGSTDIDPSAATDSLTELRRYLVSRFPGLQPADVGDIASEAITRVLVRARTGALAELTNPAGYLLQTAAHLAVDHLRSARHRREVSAPGEFFVDVPQVSDDQAAATLHRRATVSLVHAVLRRVQASDDATLFRVMMFMLNEVQKTGALPSNRQTAIACGVSHTAVAKALRRMRTHFTELGVQG